MTWSNHFLPVPIQRGITTQQYSPKNEPQRKEKRKLCKPRLETKETNHVWVFLRHFKKSIIIPELYMTWIRGWGSSRSHSLGTTQTGSPASQDSPWKQVHSPRNWVLPNRLDSSRQERFSKTDWPETAQLESLVPRVSRNSARRSPMTYSEWKRFSHTIVCVQAEIQNTPHRYPRCARQEL